MTSLIFVPEREPIIQYVRSESLSDLSAIYFMREISEFMNAPTTIPDSTSESELRFRNSFGRVRAALTARVPPRNAHTDTPNAQISQSIAIPAPTQHPELTPRISGETSLLPKVDW